VWANHLKLWRLCGNAKCRRARACRGKVHLCARPNFLLLPEGVRDFFHDLTQAQDEGLSFEDAIERLDESGAVEAFEDWNAAVAASVMRYSPHSAKGR
jgi:hypothetical protein